MSEARRCVCKSAVNSRGGVRKFVESWNAFPYLFKGPTNVCTWNSNEPSLTEAQLSEFKLSHTDEKKKLNFIRWNTQMNLSRWWNEEVCNALDVTRDSEKGLVDEETEAVQYIERDHRTKSSILRSFYSVEAWTDENTVVDASPKTTQRNWFICIGNHKETRTVLLKSYSCG